MNAGSIITTRHQPVKPLPNGMAYSGVVYLPRNYSGDTLLWRRRTSVAEEQYLVLQKRSKKTVNYSETWNNFP